MRLVVASPSWEAFGGTETYLLTVSEHLQRLGHELVLHVPKPGKVSELAGDRGLRVATKASELPAEPDGVLAGDTATAYELAGRFPHAVRVYVAHSRDWDPQTPPQLRGVCHAVVALNDRVRSHCEALATCPELIRLRQPIDILRFGEQASTKLRARRVLVIGNHWAWGERNPRLKIVSDACRSLGLEIERVGLPDRPTTAPETKIAEADIVVGMGRCVLEAMTSRRAAYVYGVAGGDGWVTPQRYPALEANGFAGTATDVVVNRDRIRQDLADFSPEMGEVNRDLAMRHHDAEAHAVELVELFRRCDPSPPPESADLEEFARLVRAHWESGQREAIATGRSRVYLAQLEAAREETADERAKLHRLRAELEGLRLRHAAIVEGRRWRLISLLASPIDLLRRIAARVRAGR
jgi:O-antigen biosynthesis protein